MTSSTSARGNGHAVSRDLSPTLVRTDKLKALGRETRRHPRRQLEKLATSLDEFGFVLPVIVDGEQRVVAGWGLVLAARQLGLPQVPAVTIADLDDSKLRLLRLALNRLGEDSSWDTEALALEFSDVLALDQNVDLQISGFEMGEIDAHLLGAGDEEDELPPIEAGAAVTRPGDTWILGDHRLHCGNALDTKSFDYLLGDQRASMVFTDPPYNVEIDGHVSGLGRTRHSEFAMASGEMSSTEFEVFLATALGHASRYALDGSIHFVCMDWRRIKELLAAATPVYAEMKNLCVWNKSNAGMGSLYRSKHELVFVFKKGHAAHVNNIQLGRFGRHRPNVWDYPSQNVWANSAKGKLSIHPTVKPVALVADAIRDCSNQNDVILDPFGGVGTTLIAAERTERCAKLIEIDPLYVDATVRRWQHLTGKIAVHAETAQPFGASADIGASADAGLTEVGGRL
ncbi:DNA modification methylase [Bradyrhizobium sp. AZCC 2289]|uniref:DNA modification methylase n=1 Tax=Bradyrhizobium sp. AZCC 2289 TaxID=3117026 RepID=UPI002FEF0A4D